jgi:hypothetical protein
MNAEWHASNVMPKNPTVEQRIAWHTAHQKYCSCRPIPAKLRVLMQRQVADAESVHPGAIRSLLTGGDRRSIADSNRVRAMVDADASLVDDLVALTADDDWLVTQRALDLLEKLAHDHPDWIEPHKKIFIGPLARSDKWEIRLQIVRALPLFRWTPAQTKRVEEILLECVTFPQTFVQAWALDSLATLAQGNAKLGPVVERHLRAFERSARKALQSRARNIRKRMAKEVS